MRAMIRELSAVKSRALGPRGLALAWGLPPWVLWGVVCTATAGGCGESRPRVYPTRGTVQLDDGTPLRLGTIEFMPEGGGPSARGPIDRQGRFVLGTFTSDDGAVAGAHRVVIVQHLPALERESLPDEPASHGDTGLAPADVSQWETTPLRAEVQSQPDNQIDLTIAAP